MSQLKDKFDNFILSVSKHLNSINSALNGKVSTQIFNNQTNDFLNQINILTTNLNNAISILELYDGLRFEANQSTAYIYLKNSNNVTITELNVGFLNNEGTTFTYNESNHNLELRNDQNELLTSIPLDNLISNISNNISFNSQTPYKLELKNSNGTISSYVNIGIQNIQNLEQRLNSIKTIYSSDDFLTGNRIVSINDKYLRFTTLTDTVEIKDNKLILPSIYTNKFGGTQSGQIFNFSLNNNLPKIIFGNNDINELEINSKNYILKNLKQLTNQNKTLTINDNGEIAWIEGIAPNYQAGEGIDITNNIISLKPMDQVNLVFNW